MVQTVLQTTLGLDPVAQHYFDGFNAENYAAVATLFSDEGSLCPPFEAEIVGPPAIAAYLAEEASGMRAMPSTSQTRSMETGRQVIVKGRVKTPLFSVNVQWVFDISSTEQIQRAEIKLLASLQELLQFNRG